MPETTIGAILAAGVAAGLLSSVFGASIADTTGRRPVYAISLAILAPATMTLALSSLETVAIAYLVASAAIYASGPLARIYFSELSPPEARSQALGTYFATTASMAAVAPLIGGFVIEGYGYPALYTMSAIFATLAVMLAFATSETLEKRAMKISKALTTLASLPSLMKRPRLGLYYGMWIAVTLTLFAPLSFIVLYANQVLGITEAWIGIILACFHGSAALAHLTSGQVTRKLGIVNTLSISLSSGSLLLLMLCATRDVMLFAVLWVILHFVIELHDVPETEFIVENAPREARTLAMSALVVAILLGRAPAPVVASLLWAIDPAYIFLPPMLALPAIGVFYLKIRS